MCELQLQFLCIHQLEMSQDPEFKKDIEVYDLEHLFITYKKHLNTMEIMKKIAKSHV